MEAEYSQKKSQFNLLKQDIDLIEIKKTQKLIISLVIFLSFQTTI